MKLPVRLFRALAPAVQVNPTADRSSIVIRIPVHFEAGHQMGIPVPVADPARWEGNLSAPREGWRQRSKINFLTDQPTIMKLNMNKQTQAVSNDVAQLAEDARGLMAATADAAGEKISEARKRLAAALESGKELYGTVKDKAAEGAKAADKAVHEHPYPAIAIGVGVGAILGYCVGRRCGRNSD